MKPDFKKVYPFKEPDIINWELERFRKRKEGLIFGIVAIAVLVIIIVRGIIINLNSLG